MRGRLTGVIALGLSLIVSSAILGTSFYLSRQQTKTIRVVGAATKRFGSDIIKWRATLAYTAGLNGLKEGHLKMQNDLKEFKSILKEKGISEGDLTVQPVSVSPVYSNEGTVTGYSINQSMYLVSKNVGKLEAIALSPDILVDNGIFLQSSMLEYYSSHLSDIKKDLLASATVDARKRAEKIAGSSGNTISKIVSARVGVFQITEPYSTEVSDYGVYNTSTKEKDITVTMNVEFAVK